MAARFPARCARRFRPVRLIGTGGYADVYVAVQVALGRPVAVKVLHADLARDPDQARRFDAEARITASLQHPHIVIVIDHGVDQGVAWIAYELLEGYSLREVLARGRPQWREALAAARQIASALEVAHEHAVLHRDIKPDNVVEAGPGRFKVTDFGLAHWSYDTGVHTAAGIVLGTPAYMPPECIRGEEARPCADLYSLGITLYEMLAGGVPFRGPTVDAVLAQHLTDSPPPPSRVVAKLPPAVDDLLGRLLAKAPSGRPASATHVIAALDALLAPSAQPPDPRRAPTRLVKHVAAPSATDRPGDPTVAVPRRPPSLRTWPCLAALVAIMALALTADRAIRGERRASGPSGTPAPSGVRVWPTRPSPIVQPGLDAAGLRRLAEDVAALARAVHARSQEQQEAYDRGATDPQEYLDINRAFDARVGPLARSIEERIPALRASGGTAQTVVLAAHAAALTLKVWEIGSQTRARKSRIPEGGEDFTLILPEQAPPCGVEGLVRLQSFLSLSHATLARAAVDTAVDGTGVWTLLHGSWHSGRSAAHMTWKEEVRLHAAGAMDGYEEALRSMAGRDGPDLGAAARRLWRLRLRPRQSDAEFAWLAGTLADLARRPRSGSEALAVFADDLSGGKVLQSPAARGIAPRSGR